MPKRHNHADSLSIHADKNEVNSPKKILAVGDGVTFAHVIRPLELLRGLAGKGYYLHYACDPRYRHLIDAQEDISYQIIRTVPSEVIRERLYLGRPLRIYTELRQMLVEDIQLLDKLQPDVVVYDFRHTLGIAATLKGIPSICLTNAQWSPNIPRSYPIFEHKLVKPLGKKLAAIVFDLTGPLVYKLHSRAFNRLLKENGLPTIRRIEEMFCMGEYTLYMDIAELFTLKKPLETTHRFIGPVDWKTNKILPLWWQHLPEDQPMVFISPGSSGNPIYFQYAVECAQKMMNLTVVIAAAGQLKTMTNTDKDTFVSDYLPLEKVMGQADVVICNGGSGMVYQALEMGTPVLAIPCNIDQHLITEKMVNAGAGLSIPAGIVAKAEIEEKLKRLLTDHTFAVKAKRYAKIIKSYDAHENFSEIIKKTLRISKQHNIYY